MIQFGKREQRDSRWLQTRSTEEANSVSKNEKLTVAETEERNGGVRVGVAIFWKTTTKTAVTDENVMTLHN